MPDGSNGYGIAVAALVIGLIVLVILIALLIWFIVEHGVAFFSSVNSSTITLIPGGPTGSVQPVQPVGNTYLILTGSNTTSSGGQVTVNLGTSVGNSAGKPFYIVNGLTTTVTNNFITLFVSPTPVNFPSSTGVQLLPGTMATFLFTSENTLQYTGATRLQGQP